MESRTTKVLVLGNNSSVRKMFSKAGYHVLLDSKTEKVHPDLICYTGGADVNPIYYKEQRLHRTHCDPKRDVVEALAFERYHDVPKVGICRGGQFLNVMSGGALWQHVSNHTDPHEVIDLLFTRKSLWVSSTHHQMMIPGKEGYMLGMSHNLSTDYQSYNKERSPLEYDPEVMWYPKTNSLCFQPHPEFTIPQGKAHTEYFFNLINWAFDYPEGTF